MNFLRLVLPLGLGLITACTSVQKPAADREPASAGARFVCRLDDEGLMGEERKKASGHHVCQHLLKFNYDLVIVKGGFARLSTAAPPTGKHQDIEGTAEYHEEKPGFAAFATPDQSVRLNVTEWSGSFSHAACPVVLPLICQRPRN